MSEYAPLMALVLFTLVSLGLGVVAKFFTSAKLGFLRKYFLGNRSLGAFAVALTAAVMSGGTFMGFPSLVYTYGWVVGLWIASYMVGGLTVLGLMGKRIGQLSRRTGAITLPDLFRERYGSPALGLITSLMVMIFLSVNLVAQFKAGAIVIKTVLPPSVVGWFEDEGPPVVEGPAAPGATGGPVETVAAPAPKRTSAVDTAYYIGLAVFSATVILYTAYGGFLAAIWTDVFQSIIMAIGVMILLPLALAQTGGLHAATLAGMEHAGDGFGFGPGAGRAFHTLPLAFSFFLMWAISGAGQPSTLVRLMAFRNSRTLRYSIAYLTIYNMMVYVPLILIFVCARSILPDLANVAGGSDQVMPMLCQTLANPYIAGLILAAPYGAVMSTVSGFLLIVASGLVRDLYQRFLRPTASEREIEWMSYAATAVVGALVAAAALNPPQFLQLVIIFSGASMAAAFLAPALLGCYWRRATATGAVAAMVIGPVVTVALYVTGYVLGLNGYDQGVGPPPKPPVYGPYYLLGFDPCVWGLGSSLLAGVIGSLVSAAPDPVRVALLFDEQPPGAPAPATLDLHPELGQAIEP